MAGGAIRGAFSAWLGLIALQAVSTKGGSGRISEAFGDVASIVERVLDPDVPAIPDRRDGGAGPSKEDAARIKDAQAAGGSQGTTSSRAFGRLPIPDPPK